MPELIAQFRNNLLFETQDEYDCSQTPIDWSTRGTPRPYFGSLCILVCCLGLFPYLACLPILWEMRKSACYKMMFCLAIMDMGTLVGNIFGGIIFVSGGMFCHAPKTFYAVTFLAVGCFFSSCCACLMIAINRFVELFNVRPLLRLYQYTSYFLVANNFGSPTLSTSLYLIMIFRIIAKRGSMTSSDSVNRAAIMLSIQCGVIVVFHATTCLGYVCLQIYPTDLLCYAMQLSWIIMHGLPPFVYVTFNPAIRKGLMQIAAPSQSMFVSTSIKMTRTSSIHHLAKSSSTRIESSAF